MSDLEQLPFSVSHPMATVAAAARERVISELKADFQLAVFYQCPRFLKGQSWLEYAAGIGLSPEEARDRAEQFLAAGLWEMTTDGLRQTTEFMDLGDLSVSEHLSMALNLTSRISETGPCWYESMLIPTTDKLRREFYKDINRVFTDFFAKSAQVQPEVVMGWSHVAVDDAQTTLKESNKTRNR